MDPTLTDVARLEQFQKRIRRLRSQHKRGLEPATCYPVKPDPGWAPHCCITVGAPPTRLSVLKIDIESYEFDALPGCGASARRASWSSTS